MHPPHNLSPKSDIQRVLVTSCSTDLANGSLRVPFDTGKALNDVNLRIKRNRKEQEAYLRPLEKILDDANVKDKKKMGKGKKRSEPNSGGDDSHFDGQGEETKDSSLFTRLWRYLCCCFEASAKIAASAVPFFSEVPSDDGLRALSADDYVKMRLLPVAAEYSKKAPGLAVYVQFVVIIGVVLSVASSALSTFGLSVFIPSMLALSGAITAWANYVQIELRLLQTNAALSSLNKVGFH